MILLVNAVAPSDSLKLSRQIGRDFLISIKV
jgi:hypothetical protein